MQNDLWKKAVAITVFFICLQTCSTLGSVCGLCKNMNDGASVSYGTDHQAVLSNAYPLSPHRGASGVTFFHAPYNASSGQKDEGGEGQNMFHHAHWAAWQATGMLHVDAEARAAGVDAVAYAQATAQMLGPYEGSYRPDSPGNYVLMMVFLLNGEAGSTDTYGGKATASLNLSGRLENLDTHQTVDSFTRVVYYGAQTYRSWSLRPFVIFFRVNLSTAYQYQFSALLSTTLHASTEKLLSTATTSSSLSARLLLVMLLPSK